MNFLRKNYNNDELKISLTTYLDDKNEIWFLGKEVATLLGYNDTNHLFNKITYYPEGNR